MATLPDQEPEATHAVVLADVHTKTDVPPAGMAGGLKVSVMVGSGMTVRVAEAVVDPLGPAQDSP